MKTISYNGEFVYATAMFMDVFNDIKIETGKGKTIKVKCLNGRRSRIFKSLENPTRSTIKPPLIIFKRTGISRDSSRVADLNTHVLRMNDNSIDYDYIPPNPINITFEVTVATKNMTEMEKILCNFIPFSNQSFVVETKHPKRSGETIKHEVVWDGDISEDDISELDFESVELYTATTNFTFKTWIWANTGMPSSTEEGVIKKINVTPNLCSVGVQALLLKNSLSTAEELSALSGFMLDDDTYYGDIYSLSHWYAVPTDTDFDDFEDKIVSGYIDPLYYDNLPISAGTSGYLKDLGIDPSWDFAYNLSGNPVYVVDNEGGIIIYTNDDPNADEEVQLDPDINYDGSTLSAACVSGALSVSTSAP